MGCNTSKIDDSEVVIRCKGRKRLMKEAVNYREDFARAHFAYIQAMKTFGVALLAFAGDSAGDSADEQSPTDSPSTPILSLPKASSPPAPALSPPPPPPPQPPDPPPPAPSPPPPPPPPSSPPPPAAPSSPPAKSSSPAPDLSPPSGEMSRAISMPPVQSESRVASPERSPFSSPLYSPPREDMDDFFMAFPPPPPHISLNPPPPPSPPRSYGWDFLGLFNPPPIPFHLQEHRRMIQVDEFEEEEPLDLEQVREEEGIPELEEEGQKEEVEQEGPKDEVKDMAQVKEETTQKASADSGEKTLEKGVETDKEMVPEKTEEVVAEREVVAAKEVTVETEKKESEKVEKKELAVVTTAKGQNLMVVARHLQNHFAKACESGKNLSGMLEPQRIHHHFGFLELRDTAKVFNAITWHWSSKTSLAFKDVSEDDDLAECGMAGSHASTLERLYAWEKKLYDEVKAGEIIRIAFDKKRQQLQSHDTKGDDHTAIDKTRAIVKSLDTRLIVAIRAIHSISIRIQKLTEEELYPQLEEILQGLMNMWKVMLECHKIQYEIAMEMDSLGNSAAGDEASEAHRKATIELENELNKWQRCFSLWINSQQCYIDTLLAWLRLCLMQPESNEGTNMSPYWIEGSRIYALIRNWHHALKRLKDKADVVDAISNFATVVHSLHTKQFEELRQKKTAEGFAKDVDRKTLSIQNMEKKYLEYPENDSNDKQDPSGVRSTVKHTLQERRDALTDLRSRMEHEKEQHSKAVQDRRVITLSSLKKNLPSIFEAMASFAAAAVEEFEGLHQESANNKYQPTENGKLPQISEE